MANESKTISVPSVDAGFVKALGPISATTIVMGSMIGSGIFIVSADIARLVESPALLIGAWLLTGFLTITGALAYGELAAMMPHAGGQYVYLRESLGPLWGFLYGWTLFLVIQAGTIAAVGVAFGKFLGVLLPSVSSTHWLLHIAHVPPIPIGPMVLGNMDVGLNTQNLAAIVIVIFLSMVNIFGVRTGAAVQNIFTFAKTAALLGLVLLGLFLGRNAQALAANFGANFWRNAGWNALHPVQVGVGGPIALVGMLTILAVAQVGSLFSSDAWNNITFTAAEVQNPRRNLPLALALGTGAVTLLYVLANVVYLTVLPLQGDAHGATILARGIQYASEERVATAVMQQMFGPSGAVIMAVAILISTFGCNNGLILGGRAGLLRHGERWPVLPRRGQASSQVPHAGALARHAMPLDMHSVHFRKLRPAARLHHFCGAGVLHFDHCRPVCSARQAARRAAAVSRHRLPGTACDVHFDRNLY